MTVSYLRVRWLTVLTILGIAGVLSACSDSSAPTPEPHGHYPCANRHARLCANRYSWLHADLCPIADQCLRFGQCRVLSHLRSEGRRLGRMLGFR